MMTARQILLLFGFFLSMFYIFKYGDVASLDKQTAICNELHQLQTETIIVISPIIRADKREASFDVKMDAAMDIIETQPAHSARQDKIRVLQTGLGTYRCPAPSMAQLAKIAAGS